LKDVVDFVANDAFDRNGCRILQELDLQLVQEPLQICPGRHGAHGPMLARRRMHSPPRRGGVDAPNEAKAQTGWSDPAKPLAELTPARQLLLSCRAKPPLRGREFRSISDRERGERCER